MWLSPCSPLDHLLGGTLLSFWEDTCAAVWRSSCEEELRPPAHSHVSELTNKSPYPIKLLNDFSPTRDLKLESCSFANPELIAHGNHEIINCCLNHLCLGDLEVICIPQWITQKCLGLLENVFNVILKNICLVIFYWFHLIPDSLLWNYDITSKFCQVEIF